MLDCCCGGIAMNKKLIINLGMNFLIIGSMIGLKIKFGWKGAAVGILVLIIFTMINNWSTVTAAFEYGYRMKDHKQMEEEDKK